MWTQTQRPPQGCLVNAHSERRTTDRDSTKGGTYRAIGVLVQDLGQGHEPPYSQPTGWLASVTR